MRRKFREGDRVRLLPFEDQPEEYGEVCGDEEDEVVIVQLDDEYFTYGSKDDGLREMGVVDGKGTP